MKKLNLNLLSKVAENILSLSEGVLEKYRCVGRCGAGNTAAEPHRGSASKQRGGEKVPLGNRQPAHELMPITYLLELHQMICKVSTS